MNSNSPARVREPRQPFAHAALSARDHAGEPLGPGSGPANDPGRAALSGEPPP